LSQFKLLPGYIVSIFNPQHPFIAFTSVKEKQLPQTDNTQFRIILKETSIVQPNIISYLSLDSCGFVDVGASSFTAGQVCSLQLLLGLAGEVFLGSGSAETHEHIFNVSNLEFPHPGGPSQSQSYITTAGQSDLVLGTHLGLATSFSSFFYHFQTVAGLLIRGTLSNERSGL
jgi:hypothetical protein